MITGLGDRMAADITTTGIGYGAIAVYRASMAVVLADTSSQRG